MPDTYTGKRWESALIMNRLLLWDIDGTLVRAGEIGEAIFDRALGSVVGRLPKNRVSMSGKTDPQIVCEYLQSMDIDCPNVLPTIVQRLEVELAEARGQLARDGSPCPGSERLLARLAVTDGIAQSVLTGNISANAALKLSTFRRDQYLDLETGAYGSDHPDRVQLLPIALRRHAELRGRSFEPSDVIVIVDSPNDLACAKANGVRCVLVATGNYTIDQLSALGADEVLPNFADMEHVMGTLIGTQAVLHD